MRILTTAVGSNGRRAVALGALALLITMTMMSQNSKPQLKGKVSLDLRISKSDFLKGEFIYAEVKAKNLLNKDLQIPSLHQLIGGLKLRGADASKNPLPHVGVTIEGSDEMVSLGAQSEIVQTLSIHTDLGNDGSSRHPQKEFLPGSYEIWCTLGDIESNHITINVATPRSSEAAVHKKLLMLYGNSEMDQETIAKRIIKENPESIYLPNLYLALLGSVHVKSVRMRDSGELKRASLEFISKFPNSPFVETALVYFRDGLEIDQGVTRREQLTDNQKKDVNAELMKLRDMLPSTAVAKQVEKMVNASIRSEQ